jgi:hypothetical protein
MSEFRDVFGMRYVGLVDSSGVYTTYRVPNPQAPYPQDYIIDQQGIVQYWADQFDPQEVIRVIDRLLSSGVEASGEWRMASSELAVSPNPFRGSVHISLGRSLRRALSWDGTDDTGRRLPAGVYYLRCLAERAMPVLLLR